MPESPLHNQPSTDTNITNNPQEHSIKTTIPPTIPTRTPPSQHNTQQLNINNWISSNRTRRDQTSNQPIRTNQPTTTPPTALHSLPSQSHLHHWKKMSTPNMSADCADKTNPSKSPPHVSQYNIEEHEHQSIDPSTNLYEVWGDIFEPQPSDNTFRIHHLNYNGFRLGRPRPVPPYHRVI